MNHLDTAGIVNMSKRGTVAWFNDTKGYGYIHASDAPGVDIFVHYTAIVGPGFKTLVDGQAVEFEVVTSPKGPQALNVIKGEVPMAKSSNE